MSFSVWFAQDWFERSWKSNNIPFHRTEVHSSLLKFYDHLVKEVTKTIFLPLCGKSLDLVWLAKKGLNVTGLEFSEIAVKAVFEESGQEYSVERIGKFDVYKSKEMPLTIYKGDFWDISPEICGKFDAIWDRGAFSAIEPARRSSFVALLSALLKAGGRMLLSACYYKSDTHFDNPYSSSKAEVQECYSLTFKDIKLLNTDITPRPKFGTARYESTMYIMIRK